MLFVLIGLACQVLIFCSCAARPQVEASPTATDAHSEGATNFAPSLPPEGAPKSDLKSDGGTDVAAAPDSSIIADDRIVGDGVEGSLRASLKGVIKRYKGRPREDGSPGMQFMVCSTDYDYERKIAITSCSAVEP